MNSRENRFSAFLFIIAGCLIIARILKIINVSIPLILGLTLVIYSVPSIYMSIDKSRRIQIITSVVAFFTGIILVLIKWFEILNPAKIILPSILFVMGIIFLFLFVDNKKEKTFLYTGCFLSAIGLIIPFIYKSFFVFYFTDRIISFAMDYWHIILIIAGILLLLNREKK